MVLVNLTSLDFDQIKQSIADYIRSNSNFTDYDFEGSNLSMIIDTLAYNTYISAYNANMVTNEVFIDSATLRENVVSLARNIGYVPVSRTAAKSEVSFLVDTSSFISNFPVTAKLKAGEVCTSNGTGTSNFIFSIPEDITVPVNESGLAIFDVVLYEGSFVTETYTVSSLNPNQRYILGPSGIDTKTIRVRVKPTEQSNITYEYTLASNLNEINSYPRIYFIQEVEDERYEIIFGDGIFGSKLEDQNFIEISYITTSGGIANGISQFNYIGQVESDSGASLNRYVSAITTEIQSYGGNRIESIESIKKYAPRVYSTQNRAVTALDYETIVKQIYPEAEAVSAFGGEDLDPPQYGKVFITIKPTNSDFVADSIKGNIKRELKKYGVAGIVPEFLDLKYLYLEVFSTVYYNDNLVKDSSTISTTVSDIVNQYADSTELNKYGARFKYSKFLKIIDDSHRAITSNITSVQMRRDMRPTLNTPANYEICFGNAFHIKNTKSGYNIKTSGFKVSGIVETVYLGDLPNNNKKSGTLYLFKLNSEQEPVIVKTNMGTIDYSKGEILLSSLNIISTSKVKSGLPVIEISASPSSNDVIGKQDLYLQLDTSKTEIKTISDSIESGRDVSGFSYLVTSSYLNGTIVRP